LGGTLIKAEDRSGAGFTVLGLYNGSGINASDKNENKDLAARLIAPTPYQCLISAGLFYDGSIYLSESDKSGKPRPLWFDPELRLQYSWLSGENISTERMVSERTGRILFPGRLFLLAEKAAVTGQI
jgi:hypothetical protein